jgi:hypothetical protein
MQQLRAASPPTFLPPHQQPRRRRPGCVVIFSAKSSDVARAAGARGLNGSPFFSHTSGPPFFSRTSGPDGGIPDTLISSRARLCARPAPPPPPPPRRQPGQRCCTAPRRSFAAQRAEAEPRRRPPKPPTSSPFRGNHRLWRPRTRSCRLHLPRPCSPATPRRSRRPLSHTYLPCTVREEGEGACACLSNSYGQSWHFIARLTPLGHYNRIGVKSVFSLKK